MHEEKSRVWVEKFMNDKSDLPEDYPPYSSERQLSAEARSLLVEYLDSRRSEGFTWMHYGGFEWEDDGPDGERLTILFGARFLVIFGSNLSVLIDDIREGKLNRIREMPGARRKQLEDSNPDNLAIIREIRAYPSFRSILEDIRGENDEQRTRTTRRA
jgi:hypothetical protein